MSWLYNAALFLLSLAYLPKLFQKKYRGSLKQRLGFKLPHKNLASPVIWIHMVSVGETRAMIPLVNTLREKFQNASFVYSSVTQTGFQEVQRSLPRGALHFYLPVDFSWVMKKMMRRIKPNLLLLSEGDLWFHMLKYAKEEDAATFVVNGKISETSARRFSRAAFFSNKLFPLIDRFCVQNTRVMDRLIDIGVEPIKIEVTGNLKLDIVIPRLSPLEKEQWKRELGISSKDRVLVIGSTHDPEEKLLLDVVEKIGHAVPNLKVILVPRHPERFSQVWHELKNSSSLLYSKRSEKSGNERVILIDQMGLLHKCYQLGEVAIVGGSFVEGVGGHNIFEPVQLGVPVLFGPHMETQQDLVDLILHAHAGKQLSLDALTMKLLELLKEEKQLEKMTIATNQLVQDVHGTAQRTWEVIHSQL